MALRKRKPTSPGRRFQTGLGLLRDHEDHAREVAARAQAGYRRPQQPRPQDRPPPRRRPQAAVPHRRLQAQQGRRPGQGRGHRVRPQPQRPHRPVALPRRREALHPRAGPGQGRRRAAVRARCRDPPGQRPAHALHPGRLGHPQRRAAPRRRRQDGPRRGHERPAGGQGGRVRHPAPALDRDAPRPHRLPGARSARSATPRPS